MAIEVSSLKIRENKNANQNRNFLSNFERRYLDTQLTKCNEIFLFKFYVCIELKEKSFIEFGQIIIEIFSLKVRKKFDTASILIHDVLKFFQLCVKIYR